MSICTMRPFLNKAPCNQRSRAIHTLRSSKHDVSKCFEGDDDFQLMQRERAESRLGVNATPDQLARSIHFRFKAPYVPRLVKHAGRVRFHLLDQDVLSDEVYFATMCDVTDRLNSWLLCGYICERILSAPVNDCTKNNGLVMDIVLEVRTLGVLSREWDLDD